MDIIYSLSYTDPSFEFTYAIAAGTSDPTPQWIPFGHKALDLIDRFRARGEEMQDPHHITIKAWEQSLSTDEIFDQGFAGNPYNVAKDRAMILAMIPWINHIVFQKALKPGNFTFEFIEVSSARWKPATQLLGVCQDNRKLPGITAEMVTSHVIIYQLPDSMDSRDRLLSYIDTAFHELLHAVLHIYSCKCADCTQKEIDILGVTGHGPLWAHSASLEAIASKCMGFDNINIGRHFSIATELVRQNILLKADDSPEWGLDGFDTAILWYIFSIW